VSHAARAKRARKVLPGYPVETPFGTPEEVVEYFSRDKITCLLCGKQYRTLGVHLKAIHNTTPDEYRSTYGLPYTHGLSCSETTEIHAALAKEKYESGEWVASKEQASLARAGLPNQRGRQPYRKVLADRNIDKMNEGKTGEAAARRKAAPKRGTPEFKELMRQRPQTKNNSAIKGYWKGRTQTDEHVFRRTGRHKKALSEDKA